MPNPEMPAGGGSAAGGSGRRSRIAVAGVCLLGVAGLQYEMTRAGNDFFVTGIQTTPQGQQRATYQVGLVYGSGSKRDEMYFAWQEDRLFHLPVAWLHPYDRWGNAINSIHGRE